MAEKKSTAKTAAKETEKKVPETVTAEDTKKEGTKTAAEAVKKPAAKKTTVKKTPAKKTAVKKTTTIKAKTEEAKAVKEEKTEEKAVKEEKTETAAKKAPAKKTTVAKKTTTKKAATAKKEPAKKTTAKKTTEKKAAAKPAAAKATSKKVKVEQYESFSMDSCIAMMQAMGVHYSYDDYARELMNEADLKKIEQQLISDFKLNAEAFDYDNDGYDLDLIPVVLTKIAETVDFKASDYPKMAEQSKACIAYEMGSDFEKDGEEYLNEFHLFERILMIAQRQGLHSQEELKNVIDVELNDLMRHFMRLARTVLPRWQYDDVKFYENFAYALLSQFNDLFVALNNELMMDVADLYILHEDYGHGDADYNYIIRENQIKDYIYYRFAHVYEDIDLDKAKGIAYDALQYVDGRYDYYQPIIDILNRQ